MEANEKYTKCLNCGVEFDKQFGYCPHCGQRNNKLQLHMKYFLGDFISSSFNIDSKIIRTLRLLIFYPGKLSREFLSGKRASYVPPVRLYIVISLVYFSFLSLLSSDIVQIEQDNPKKSATQNAIADTMLPDTIVNQEKMQEGAHQKDAIIKLSNLDELIDAKADSLSTEDAILKNKWKKMAQKRLKRLTTKEGRHDFVELLRKYISIGMFILMPLTALIFFLLFYRNTFYVQHLVFVLHLQSMMYILFILMNVIDLLFKHSSTSLLNTFLFLFVLFIWIKKFYEISWGKTIWKSFLFLILYGFSFGIFFILVALISAWHLA